MTDALARVTCGDRTIETRYEVRQSAFGEPRLIEFLDVPADFACDEYVRIELMDGRSHDGLMLGDTKVCTIISTRPFPRTIPGPG
jgi:hypothetical protein